MRTETIRTIICSASVITEARDLVAHFPGGAGMLATPLYTGTEITHYVSSGHCSQEIVDAATQAGATNHSGDPFAVIASLGLSLEAGEG